MLNKSIKFLIENKLVAVLMLLLFVSWGIVNAPFNWETGFLPSNPVAVDAIPDIGENQQIVFTKWDGRSPQDIEDQITYPLTTSLLGIPGVKTIRSSSMFGFSSIYIIFDEDIEFYWSRSRILEKLNSLPSGLLPEGVNPALGPDATGLGQIFWYTLEGRDENVTNGTFTVDAAAQLQGKKSMMNKEGGKVSTGHEGHLGLEEVTSKTNEKHSNMIERIMVSTDFQNQLEAVFNNYIKLKDALVKDDSEKVTTDAMLLLSDLSKVDMKLLSDSNAHNHWMSLENEIKASASLISDTSNIKEQRNHFKYLSSHLINAVQLFGINEKVYVEFCPMADNNKGAYWLSKEKKVINPYFGDAMLTCGEVKQVIE